MYQLPHYLLTQLLPSVVAIPLTVLWRVKIRLQQKLVLGIFLCLSIVIVIVAIVQISGEISANHQIDLQWELFWQQIEASISIIVVSITGFRTLLGMRAQKKRHQSENRRERLQSYRDRLLRKALRRNPVDRDVNANRLPSIPNATLTGMRTLINGGKSERDFAGGNADQSLAISTITDGYDDTQGADETSLVSTEVCGLPILVLEYWDTCT